MMGANFNPPSSDYRPPPIPPPVTLAGSTEDLAREMGRGTQSGDTEGKVSPMGIPEGAAIPKKKSLALQQAEDQLFTTEHEAAAGQEPRDAAINRAVSAARRRVKYEDI